MIHLMIKKLLQGNDGPLLLDVNLHIQAGSVLGVMGKSGTGKTSLLRILAGLLNPDYGFVKVQDKIWYSSFENIDLPIQKRDIGFVFQDFALFPNMTVEENLFFALKNKELKDFAHELLEAFEIEGLSKKKPNQISGGQRQRVALARALVRRPLLLLLDEPFSALDDDTSYKIQNILKHFIKKNHISTIFVSHSIEEITYMSDDLLNLGKTRRFIEDKENNRKTVF